MGADTARTARRVVSISVWIGFFPVGWERAAVTQKRWPCPPEPWCRSAYACAGYTVTVRGKHGDRFDLLRRHNINFNLVDDEGEVDGLRPGRFGPALMSYPYVVEASGDPSGWNAAVELVSPGGSVLLMSSCCDGAPRTVSRIQEKNIRVFGLREGSIASALSIVEEGLFDPSEVVSSVVDFQNVLDAYRRARASDAWLVLLRMRN